MCPVNYSCSKLSGNEVPGSSPGPSSRLCPLLLSSPFSFSLSFPLFFSFAKHCPPPLSVEHPPVERERTNKSARALRRDIVSCKVNHLRGSKTAASPCRDLLSPPREASRRRLLPPQCRFARYSAAQASPLLPLSHFLLALRPPRPQLVFLAVSPVSVNMRTHSLVISVIGSLMPSRAALTAPIRTAKLSTPPSARTF